MARLLGCPVLPVLPCLQRHCHGIQICCSAGCYTIRAKDKTDKMASQEAELKGGRGPAKQSEGNLKCSCPAASGQVTDLPYPLSIAACMSGTMLVYSIGCRAAELTTMFLARGVRGSGVPGLAVRGTSTSRLATMRSKRSFWLVGFRCCAA